MKAGWVAGSVRARLLASRRLGSVGARHVAAAGSVDAAVALVAASSYGRDVTATMGPSDAARGVQATVLWHLRVLAGWLPSAGSDVVRVLAGGYEIANIEGHLDEIGGGPPARPFGLGALATAWPRVARAGSVAAVRAELGGSPWGDPGTDERAAMSAALQLSWADRIVATVPELRRWATAGAAIVVAGERFGHDRSLSGAAAVEARRILGPAFSLPDLATFAAGLPTDARWVFEDVTDPHDLWLAEAAWRRALRREAASQVGRARTGGATVAWAAVLLLADARQVGGALEAAAWGAAGLEAFDAVA